MRTGTRPSVYDHPTIASDLDYCANEGPALAVGQLEQLYPRPEVVLSRSFSASQVVRGALHLQQGERGQGRKVLHFERPLWDGLGKNPASTAFAIKRAAEGKNVHDTRIVNKEAAHLIFVNEVPKHNALSPIAATSRPTCPGDRDPKAGSAGV